MVDQGGDSRIWEGERRTLGVFAPGELEKVQEGLCRKIADPEDEKTPGKGKPGGGGRLKGGGG